MKAALTLLVPLALLPAGCSLVGAGAPVEVREYDLLPAPAPDEAREADVVPVTLQLPRFDVDPALDRDGLVWRRGAVEVGAYALHRWARPPQEAVRDGLARALAALPGVVVAAEPALPAPTHVLRAHLARCEEQDEGERWLGVLEVRVALARQGGPELLRRAYAERVPAAERNPAAVVAALRIGLERVAARLATDVASALRPGEGPATR